MPMRSASTLVAVCGLALSAAAVAQPAAKPAGKPADDAKARVNVSDQSTIDLAVRDEDIRAVLELLAVQTKRNIIASRGVSGKVSADLFGVTFSEALDALLQVNGFAWRQQGNFIFVYTKEELDKIKQGENPRVAKVIRLTYLNAPDAADLVKPMLSQGGEIKTSKAAETYAVPDSAPTGKDDFASGATLVVIDFAPNIEAIEKLLAELDTKPTSVLVEATVMRTILNESNAFGIDFSIIGDVKFTDFATVGGPLGAAGAIARGTGTGTSAGFSPADNKGFGVGTGLGALNGPATMRVGVVSNNLAIVAKLLDSVSDTAVLANPKLMVLNRQPSKVQVLQRLPYLSSTIAEGGSRTETVQFLDIGVNLFFRPFVLTSGEIRMELKPQISDGTLGSIRGTGGEVTAPFESRQEVTTNVIVKDGNTIVLGGLFRETITANRSQVPVLGSLPIVGTPFRGHDDTTTREEIVFLVTPSIFADKQLIATADRTFEAINRVRAGVRQGLLPWSREKLTSSLNLEAEKLARDGKPQEAMWKLNRSLTLNPRQTMAQELRERLTNERENWPGNSTLDNILGGEVTERLKSIRPAPVMNPTPEGQFNVPRETIDPSIKMPAPVAPGATGPQGQTGFQAASNTQAQTPTQRAPQGQPAQFEAPAQPQTRVQADSHDTFAATLGASPELGVTMTGTLAPSARGTKAAQAGTDTVVSPITIGAPVGASFSRLSPDQVKQLGTATLAQLGVSEADPSAQPAVARAAWPAWLLGAPVASRAGQQQPLAPWLGEQPSGSQATVPTDK